MHSFCWLRHWRS